MAIEEHGHLFVVQADIRRLHVDAWLLPTDDQGSVESGWFRDNEDLRRRVLAWRQDNHPGAVARVSYLPRGEPGQPSVVMGAIPVQGTASAEYHIETVERAIALLRSSPVASVPRLTLAVPALGTGASGGASVKGGVLGGLVRGLHHLAAGTGMDIVLVLRDEKATSAARAVRRSETSVNWWTSLDSASRAQADRLAGLAVQGRLTLFTGAGVSMAAGLPSWNGLLTQLEGQAEGITGYRLPNDGLTAIDRATLIADALGEERMLKAMQRCFASSRYAVQHALLANLPAAEAVTLNYDRLLEQAAVDAGRPFQVLPYEPSKDRWLLKLHGDIGTDGTSRDVVLTRSDYLGASDHRAALTGLVQAVLTTRHLLFIGFGLRDDHVHALIHDVRRALGRPQDHRFGTALLVREDPVLSRLWEKDIDIQVVSDAVGDRTGRQIDIFLDYVANVADPSYPHLFDEAWSGVLTEEEQDLRALVQLMALEAAGRSGLAWQPLRRVLQEYGWTGQLLPAQALEPVEQTPSLAQDAKPVERGGRVARRQGAWRLHELIIRGLLRSGEELVAGWSREHVVATLMPDGQLEVNGSKYSSPSAAGQSLTGYPVNGWTFWLVPRLGNRTLEQVEHLRSAHGT